MRHQFNVLQIAIALAIGQIAQVHAEDAAKLAGEARGILEHACHRCHGENGTIEGGFSYVLNRQLLVSRQQIVPGTAAKSRLIRRILTDEMPPEGESPRLTKEQIDILSQWIDSGASDFSPPKAPRNFISTTMIIKSMRDDQKQRPEADRKFIRYLTLTHLYNAGRSDEELQGFHNGITKLVNSLSWGRRVVVPEWVGSPPTILRIDLRDHRWSANVWDKIAGSDPYGLVNMANPDAKALYADAGCALPHVRGDWFVAAASRPPLYHEILELPATVKELESLLRVDVDDNIRTGQAARSGFNGSAISRNNRLIERHDSSYGYYWKSYDFAKNVNQQNLFAHPLGPGTGDKAFKHDGGELIFSLPNGFQAYMLVNAQGQRIDKGPTEIVSDLKRPDRAVENGLSCMSCHVRGLLPKDDQIRAHVEKNPNAFSKQEVEAVLGLYPTHERFQAFIDDDVIRFRQAIERSKIPPSVNEPIMALTTLFESELDLPIAAAEANLSPDGFLKLMSRSTELARVLGSLQTENGTVKREVFVSVYPTLAHAAKLGSPITKSAQQVVPAPGGKDLPKQKQSTSLVKAKSLPKDWTSASGFTSEKNEGIRTNNGTLIISKDRDFLNKDFVLEVVLTMKQKDGIAIIGFGDVNSGGGNDPPGTVRMRIHPPGLSDGEVYFTKDRTTLSTKRVFSQTGTHLFRITKEGTSVTLSVDVDMDGESPDDAEFVFPDVKEVLPGVHGKNGHLFFGGGGVFKSVSLTTTDLSKTNASNAANLEPSTAKAKGDGAWIPLGGKNKYPSLLAPSAETVSSKDGLGTTGRFYIMTKKGDFLERDFKFELVFTLKDGSANQIMFFGIGEADRNSAYNEPKNSIYLGICPPNFDNGRVALTNKITGDNVGIGRIASQGPHRATIEKSGDVVTFSMDVDDDGPSDDDFETTIPDLKAAAKTLHKKNTFLFFGGGGTYHRLQLVDVKDGN